jgi:hypothetical protein
MMHKTLPFLFVPTLIAMLLAGCGSGSNTIGACNCPIAPQGNVSITMTDDPPAGVNVLFFQVSLTDATLTSTSGSTVSLLNNIVTPTPSVQIDVTQLQALSAFLSLAQVPPGTYKQLSMTFTNPQLVIFNQSDSSLGSTCAVGTICKLTPTFDNNSSTLTFTSSPFPVTVGTSSPLGFLIDFHLNTVIQSDLSVNLAATNGVTISQLPSTPTPPQFGVLTGTIAGVSASTDQFSLQAPWGGRFTVATTSSTAFNNFPASACTTPSIACLAQGQIVRVKVAGFAAYGIVTASEVDYVQPAATETVEGTIINLIPSTTTIANAPPTLVLLLHWNPTSDTSIPLGGIAKVSLSMSATYAIDANGFTMPSGLSFTAASNLSVGQDVQVTVTPGTLSTTSTGPGPSAWGPPPSISFTGSAVELEPSQMTGTISATDAGTTSFTLGVGGQFFAPWPMPSAVSSYDVLTTSQTSFTGFNPDSFSGLAKGELVSVNGWLFSPSTSGGSPIIAAQSVVQRPAFAF